MTFIKRSFVFIIACAFVIIIFACAMNIYFCKYRIHVNNDRNQAHILTIQDHNATVILEQEIAPKRNDTYRLKLASHDIDLYFTIYDKATKTVLKQFDSYKFFPDATDYAISINDERINIVEKDFETNTMYQKTIFYIKSFNRYCGCLV